MFALDIGPYDEVGLDFDRVARRFGVGRPTWVELPDIGGDFVGQCSAADLGRQSCVLLWHLDGLVIGVEFLGGDELDVDSSKTLATSSTTSSAMCSGR